MKNVNEKAKVVGKRGGKQNRKHLKASISYVATSNAEKRLGRAVDILLRASARNTAVSAKSTIAEEQKTPRYAPSEEGLADGEKGVK